MAQNIILLLIFFSHLNMQKPFVAVDCTKAGNRLDLARRPRCRVFYGRNSPTRGALPALPSPLPLPTSPSPLYTSHHLAAPPPTVSKGPLIGQILSVATESVLLMVVVSFRGNLSVISSGKRH